MNSSNIVSFHLLRALYIELKTNVCNICSNMNDPFCHNIVGYISYMYRKVWAISYVKNPAFRIVKALMKKEKPLYQTFQPQYIYQDSKLL